MMTIQVDLPADQAWAFAEFLKRARYSDYRQLAASDQEAYDMQGAARPRRCGPRSLKTDARRVDARR